MRKSNIDLFKAMLRMQEEYDQKVFEAHELKGYQDIEEKIDFALLDEIGELNHALKGNWCWWKFTQSPVDQEEVLSEFADVIHFCLMKILANPYRYDVNYIDKTFEAENGTSSIGRGLIDMAGAWICQDPIRIIRSGMKMLHIDWAEAFEAYKQKNAINLERVRGGY